MPCQLDLVAIFLQTAIGLEYDFLILCCQCDMESGHLGFDFNHECKKNRNKSIYLELL